MEGQEVTIAIIIIVLLVGALLAWLFIQRNRTRELRDRYGEEYDRTLEAKGGRRSAEADLVEREERVKKLEIRPLSASERDRFAGEWKDTKALFVDSPVEAVSRADRLLTDIMSTRGYPMADFEKRHADLTVDHGDVAKHYLAGHEIADRSSDATTEELRRAINHYEALYGEMTSEVSDADQRSTTEYREQNVSVEYGDVDSRDETAPVRPSGDPALRDRDRV
ncbi:hypothetical protein K3175_06110 [Qipengyuania sp. GH1]|uniref:hypothetical protein n=1 Tax=Qipengyuania aestuarii TaxID=2867241 RepID=UPI001C885DF5|nr:hypothetical protein [Qipengyuania aestuarii]MBX7535228.1 hypothetical protein [Qipengyuania aestuarii]